MDHAKMTLMKATTKRRFLARDDSPELEVAKVNGSYLYDTSGRKYVDFVMGWCVANLGWNNRAVKKRGERFRGPDYIYPYYAYKPWDQLAELLLSIAPKNLGRCFRATGGSEAVDIALQAALIHTGRRKLVSLEGSYHGNSLAGLSIGDSENREHCKNLLPHCDRIRPPLDAKALDDIERRLKRRDVAAFIMEPISINLGVLIPRPDFMTALQRLCRNFGTLLIADEVATGFGRTGNLFACEHFKLKPDIMCVAKAITGGLGGLGAVMTTPAVAKSMEEHGNFYSTYGWHPRSVDVALATIRYLKKNQTRLLCDVMALSSYFLERLSQIPFKRFKALRIQGLAIGIEFENEDYADEVQSRCRRNGLLTSTQGPTLLLLPALTMDQRLAEKGLHILARSI